MAANQLEPRTVLRKLTQDLDFYEPLMSGIERLQLLELLRTELSIRIRREREARELEHQRRR